MALDDEDAEARFQAELAVEDAAERFFDRAWAQSMMRSAWRQLKVQQEADGKAEAFSRLKPFLSRVARDGEYAELGQRLGANAHAISMAVFRLRAVLARFGHRGSRRARSFLLPERGPSSPALGTGDGAGFDPSSHRSAGRPRPLWAQGVTQGSILPLTPELARRPKRPRWPRAGTRTEITRHRYFAM